MEKGEIFTEKAKMATIDTCFQQIEKKTNECSLASKNYVDDKHKTMLKVMRIEISKHVDDIIKNRL